MDEQRAFEPGAILAVLERQGVRYVLVGGLASEAHHAPLPRTEDLDITPATDLENLSRLSTALRELDAKIRTRDVPAGLPFFHDARSLAGVRVWNLITRYGPMDLAMVPDGTEGYDDLLRDAATKEVAGLEVCVASLRDIIRSKEAAGRAKDLLHLPILYQTLREQERGER